MTNLNAKLLDKHITTMTCLVALQYELSYLSKVITFLKIQMMFERILRDRQTVDETLNQTINQSGSESSKII